MKPEEFVSAYHPDAVDSEVKSGINALFTLAQAAHESGWSKYAFGFNFFGIKSFSPSDKRQLLKTTEYFKQSDKQFPEIISITEEIRDGEKWYKYSIRDWFRKYDTAAECFNDHAQFFYRNRRYKKALEVKEDPREFAKAVAEAGYATDPNYADLLVRMIDKIEKLV